MGYARVVVGTDGSATAELAVRTAAELAPGAHLLVVTAFPEPPPDGPTTTAPAPERAPVVAARGRAVAEAAGATNVEVRTGGGNAADVLLHAAADHDADLVVVGSLGMTGPSRFLLGGVANAVTHNARCDVLVVHTNR